MKIQFALAFIFTTLILPAHAQQKNALPPDTKVLRDIAYVENGHERQKLDLYLPADTQTQTQTRQPLIVWIHGGAWRGGSKKGCPAKRLVGNGYAVASINYRLSQHAKFPAQIEDCKAAIRWLRANAEKHGYDPQRIGVWGSSAGGHLVALLGTSGDVKELEGELGNADQSSRVQAVCDFFGPSDLLKMQEQGPDGPFDHNAADSPESMLVGGPIQENKEATRKASPVSYVTADDPPFLICHGAKDQLVAIGQSEVLHAALEKAKVDSQFHVVKDGGHGWFRDPKVPELVEAFFQRTLREKAQQKETND